MGAMPPRLSLAAEQTLRHKHVDVRFAAAVEDYNGSRVALRGGKIIQVQTLVWGAGAQAASLTTRLGLPTARQGRVVVEPTLQVPGHPALYVIGDAAYGEANGQPVPMMAPVAVQRWPSRASSPGWCG
jgi:NADH:ubiquinone reductase (H+-translocating)